MKVFSLAMLASLKRQVCRANLELVKAGLVLDTFGNVSGIDRERGLVVIKPSGVAYDRMQPEHMVVVNLETGAVVSGRLQPSSDAPTHLVLYRAFPEIGGIAHTHSLHATAWAQARRDLPALGTTHADFWHGPVPCTRPLTPKEIQTGYEANTGHVVVERFQGLDPLHVPAVLVAAHGPLAWGRDAAQAVRHAVVLEFVARLAGETLRLNRRLRSIPQELLDKHFFRKHGPGAYYGQAPARPGEP